MTRWTALAGPATLCLVLAGPAWAELTAVQVWDSWRTQIEDMGMTVEAATETDGDTLRLTDMVASMGVPETEGAVTARIDALTFRERGDGTVEITMAPVISIDADLTDADSGERAEMGLSVGQTGYSVIASGTPGDITYDFSAAEMSVVLDTLSMDGEEQAFDMSVVLADLSGRYRVAGEEPVQTSGSLQAATLAAVISGTEDADDDTPARIDMSIAMADVETTYDGTLAMMGSDNMARMLEAGFRISTEMSHGAATYTVGIVEDGAQTDVVATLDSGGTTSRLESGGIGYTVTANGLDMTVSGAQIPFPQLAVSVDALETGFEMPVSASDTPEAFSVTTALRGLSVDEMIWGMLDPQGMLPRDPATLVVSLSGKGNWFHDIMDPSAQKAMEKGTPGELHELTLDELQLSLAGAELTGDGDFTFDNTDLETFEGLPKPTGALDLRLVGGNGLLDTLVMMGLLPQDQAMGARMMLGLFTRPGDGEDTLVSKIEVTEDGAVVANGQRLR